MIEPHTHNSTDTPRISFRDIREVNEIPASSLVQGDIFYIDANNKIQRLGAGTSGQVLKTNGTGANPAWAADNTGTFKNGIANREFDAASGDQTIAHGLGATPKFVRLSAGIYIAATSSTGLSFGSYNGTTIACISFQGTTTQTNTSSTTNVLELYHTVTTNFQKATIAVDATNITLSWTLGGSQGGTMRIMWEAIT